MLIKTFPPGHPIILLKLNLFNTAAVSVKRNSLHKNTVLRNRVCSITACLSFRKKKGIQRDTGLLFENMNFSCTYSIKTKILSMLVLGTFWKSAKWIPSKKNQSVLIAKISSRKTQKNHQSAKINSRKNFVPHGRRSVWQLNDLEGSRGLHV